MRGLLRRAAPVTAAARPAARALAGAGLAAVLLTATTAMRPGPFGGPLGAAAPRPASTATATAASRVQRIVLPDLLVIEPAGLTAHQLSKLSSLRHVRGLVAADGASIKLDGTQVNVLGVDPERFRSWTPLATATHQRLWRALERGQFVASPGLAGRLRLHPGRSYVLRGAGQQDLADGGSAALGIAGIGALVSKQATAGLGLVPGVLALVSAPAARIDVLTSAVRRIAGKSATIISLRPGQQELPVNHASGSGRPATYLDLFKASAARYCPGLSWTVLAAIGQIESGDGANNGPSSAGALGPMQFLPSTWKVWGITAFGDTGAPDIMNPFDAVPSAARLLCANGAGSPAGLRGAIFAYNHATWYVNEVLALAQQYAQDYG